MSRVEGVSRVPAEFLEAIPLWRQRGVELGRGGGLEVSMPSLKEAGDLWIGEEAPE